LSIENISKIDNNVNRFSEQRSKLKNWPSPLGSEALYGLAGELVNLVLPHTEADLAALLAQFLAMFGNVVGRDPYFQVEGTRHYPRLFVCLVGDTAKSRKGTSYDHVENRFRIVDPVWAHGQIKSGLGSGEGLIWQVRDADQNDPGFEDKRLLVSEPEFATILRVMNRKDSILSNILRSAWDDKTLQNVTKNSPAKATDAHISVIGHITRDELKRHLTQTEAANGFANRFLFICVRRSKLLPEGGQIQQVDFTDFDRKLAEAVQFAQQTGPVFRDAEARQRWIDIYPVLSAGRPGLFGALTARSEAQVVRLSLIYALLDKSAIIRLQHLEAALAFWEYAEASVRCIFGQATGDPAADRILEGLRNNPQGLTQTGISKIFNNNLSAARIGQALEFLKGYALVVEEKTSGMGRPGTIWRIS
jgi:hypothetical protein